jgi:serine phosphatase RsbU (regulator of sigma subunit)
MIEEYTWRSEGVAAAQLDAAGVIVRANAALRAVAGRDPVGMPFEALLSSPQREAFRRRIAGAGPEWAAATFAFNDDDDGDPARPAADRAVWLRRAGEGTLVVAEPAVGEQERLVEKVLELNDDLVDTQRELVRERGRLRLATQAAAAGSQRVAHLEAIAVAGLAHLRLDDVLDDVLRAIAAAVDADRAMVLLVDPVRGELVPRAAVGFEPGALEGISVPLGAGVSGAVAASGQPRLIGDLADVKLHAPSLQEAARSLAAVPLMLEGDAIGVLHVAADEPDRFGEADLALLVPAAERVAVAVSRARVHEREANIAETLQRALLPDRLPQVEGLALSARFVPGAEVQVGGDWYDALPLPSGELAVVIGDVAGKGLRAASLMGELRAALRAYALDGGEPQEILARLDRVVVRSQRMATVLLAAVDPSTGTVTFASAGHLPPLRIDAAGEAELLDGGRSTPLLAYEAVEPGRARLEPGDRLLLYTDGLVERRGESIDRSLERLVEVARGLPHGAGLDAVVDALLDRMHPPEGVVRDDTAIIAVQRR